MANQAETLRRNWLAAKERINKIGMSEPHLRSVGRLHSVVVKTTIHHQAVPSATNYWEDDQFDLALAKVIGAKFASLADEALTTMQRAADQALVAEEDALRARLADIERIKQGAAS